LDIRLCASIRRTTALRVKVVGIEEMKNAGAGPGQERDKYLTEIGGEYNG